MLCKIFLRLQFVHVATQFEGLGDELYEEHVFRGTCSGLTESLIKPEEHATWLCSNETQFSELFREAVQSISYANFFNEVTRFLLLFWFAFAAYPIIFV